MGFFFFLFDFFKTFSTLEKIENLISIFEIPVIPKFLSTDDQKTTSAKYINLDIIRTSTEDSL